MLSILYLIISQMQQSLFIYDCFCLFDYFPSVRIRFLSSGIFSEPHKPKFTFLKFNPSELKISSTLLSEHVAKTGICFISSSFTK